MAQQFTYAVPTMTYGAPQPMTYAAPAPVTYVQQAEFQEASGQSVGMYDMMDRYGDGMAQYQVAPVTYAAPTIQTMSLQTRPGIISTAAQPQQMITTSRAGQQMTMSRGVEMTPAKGQETVVGTYDVSRQELINQGRLIVMDPVESRQPPVRTRAIEAAPTMTMTYGAPSPAVDDGAAFTYGAPAGMTYVQAQQAEEYGGAPQAVTYMQAAPTTMMYAPATYYG